MPESFDDLKLEIEALCATKDALSASEGQEKKQYVLEALDELDDVFDYEMYEVATKDGHIIVFTVELDSSDLDVIAFVVKN